MSIVAHPCAASAAEYTADDIVRACEQGLPDATIRLMIESTNWHLDQSTIAVLRERGLPAQYLGLMSGVAAPMRDSAASAAIESLVGSFSRLILRDGKFPRGQVLTVTETSVVLIGMDESVQVIPRASVVSGTTVHPTIDDWRSRVGRPTSIALTRGRVVTGEIIAVEAELLVLRRATGEFLTVDLDEVDTIAPSSTAAAPEGEFPAGLPDRRTFSNDDDDDDDAAASDSRATADHDDGEASDWVDFGGPTPGQKARRGRITANAGLILAGVGAATYEIGRFTGSAELYYAGSVGVMAGPPMLAGGTLRTRQGLSEMGIDVPFAAGGIAWGCWAGALFVSAAGGLDPEADPVATGLASDFLLLGSIVSGSVQYGTNAKHLPGGSPPRESRAFSVYKITFSTSGTALSLAGQF